MIRLGALLFAIVLPISATLTGCFCEEFIITEEFENFCDDGVPCGWTATGPVTQVPTYHDNVFGVAVPAGTTLSSLEDFGSRRPGVLARCDAGASLVLNGETTTVPSDSFDWVFSGSGATTITVTGTGQCVIDDIGFEDDCLY
ncbi:MAG: hypothetical protein ACI9KE_001615 [Polyangiales bacterium]|jgi:hypothetical protein